MENYDTRLLDEISQAKPEELGYAKSYDLMVEVNNLMNQYKSREQMNANLGIKDDLPSKALETIKNFASKSAALNGLTFDPNNSNAAGYIADDLARATTAIPPQTPELTADLLNTAKRLYGHEKANFSPDYQLAEMSKLARHLGDEKVASAFVDATFDSFQKLDTFYDNTFDALKAYKDIASFHPQLAEKCLGTAQMLAEKFPDKINKQPVEDIMQAVMDNPNVSQELKDRARASKEKYNPVPKEKNGLQMMPSNEKPLTTKKPVEKQKALDFIKKGKAYAGGKKLFERAKNAINETFDKNPKLAATVGFAAMIAGCQTMQPELAAAGAIIMAEGLRHIKNKMLEKRGLRQPTITAASRPAALQQNIERPKGLRYDGR
ncbi:MAG: hypothetical protein IJ830_01235 [Alphaproteobacteria bacterium]|nr:hypothetical protein [Alphaproteobacteria bacterium]